MSDPKSNDKPASTPDQLVSSGISAADELSDQEIEGVAGGGIPKGGKVRKVMDDYLPATSTGPSTLTRG